MALPDTMKNLVSIDDLTVEDIEQLLNQTIIYLKGRESGIPTEPVLRGKTIANLFFEDSTRTRISFELAEKRLGAEIINFSASSSSLKKGETLNDTVSNLLKMKVDLIVVRHHMSGTAHFIARKTGIPVINAGDGTNEHPTQALLDFITLRRNGLPSEEIKIQLRGDILHSRVAGSGIKLWKKLNIPFQTIRPETVARNTLETSQKFQNPNVLYNLRIQKERQHKELIPGNEEYHQFFGVKGAFIPEDTFIMHPGPINRGVELDSEATNIDKSLILDQVETGVALRMACLNFLLNG
jgi:aspartate carbamoyltransferase catalytic subunit